jgi:small subunit ribosomal protein S10
LVRAKDWKSLGQWFDSTSGHKMIIKFRFKSFHQKNFKSFLPKILQKINEMAINTKGVASLPTQTLRYTVLRSPHVDKKSREQFETKIYNKLLILSFDLNNELEKQKVKLLINFIKNSSSGLNFKITYII